jgi:hypothetical protein
VLFDILDMQSSLEKVGAVQHDRSWNGTA